MIDKKALMFKIGNYKDYDKHKYVLNNSEFNFIYSILKFRIDERTVELYGRMKQAIIDKANFALPPEETYFALTQEEAYFIYKMLYNYVKYL